MKLLSIILFVCNFISSHQTECDEVKAFFETNHGIVETISSYIGEYYAKEAIAVVAPEVWQYSSLSDKAETYALKVLYAQTGKGNFSIGYFQMKPTFAETIEQLISKDNLLSLKYKVLLIEEETIQAQRAERVERLSSLKYQCIYLSAFFDLASRKISSWPSSQESDLQKLRNIATLYNAGIDISQQTCLSLQEKKQFPSFSSNKFNYSFLVAQFYNFLFSSESP